MEFLDLVNTIMNLIDTTAIIPRHESTSTVHKHIWYQKQIFLSNIHTFFV